MLWSGKLPEHLQVCDKSTLQLVCEVYCCFSLALTSGKKIKRKEKQQDLYKRGMQGVSLQGIILGMFLSMKVYAFPSYCALSLVPWKSQAMANAMVKQASCLLHCIVLHPALDAVTCMVSLLLRFIRQQYCYCLPGAISHLQQEWHPKTQHHYRDDFMSQLWVAIKFRFQAVHCMVIKALVSVAQQKGVGLPHAVWLRSIYMQKFCLIQHSTIKQAENKLDMKVTTALERQNCSKTTQ